MLCVRRRCRCAAAVSADRRVGDADRAFAAEALVADGVRANHALLGMHLLTSVGRALADAVVDSARRNEVRRAVGGGGGGGGAPSGGDRACGGASCMRRCWISFWRWRRSRCRCTTFSGRAAPADGARPTARGRIVDWLPHWSRAHTAYRVVRHIEAIVCSIRRVFAARAARPIAVATV